MMRWPPKPSRPLPLACAAMALLLLVKAGEVARAVGGAPAALLSAGRAVVPAAQAAGHEPARAPAPAAPPAASLPASPPPPAEPPVSESERALLLDLRARRAQVEAREQALTTRESILAAAEKRIAERVEQLQALQARLESLEGARRERDEANWRGLVRTYEAMRPRDAAVIMNELDMPVLLDVLDRMKEARAGAVLAAMQPDRARAATAQLAAQRTRGTAPPTLNPTGPSRR